MDHAITNRPHAALLRVSLDQGESIRAEPGTMVRCTRDIDVTPDISGGGLTRTLKRRLFGQDIFRNTFTAESPGEVTFAPPFPGDVIHHDLDGALLVPLRSYLASAADLDITPEYLGGKSFFGRDRPTALELDGEGPVFLASRGDVNTHDLADGETCRVDSGHVVAFEADVGYAVERLYGHQSMMYDDNALAFRFAGPGRVWIQTRTTDVV